ncbi:MAG: hypothetical protein OK454_00830 [Thaumarchaeota archaeon]|nr:hypothetical protein [Nitrososphaerota archaeon]
METLWPYAGFTVKAVENKLGEGRLTLTGKSLLFERNDGLAIGFGFPNLRMIRLNDVHTVELAYSLQGELRSVLFRVLCTFPDGTARDELPSRDEPSRMSLLRAITGGVVARFLADHSDARTEGLSKMADEKFEARIKDLRANVALFPDKKQFEDNVWWDEALRKRSLEAGESEPVIWDDPYRDRIFYTGTNPTMTVDNAFEKLDLLQDDWVNGRLDPRQRARSVALGYLMERRQNELGYLGVNGEPTTVWNDAAQRLVQYEKRAGVDILQFL